tara:strand:- start:2946 stop:3158 length:213 start_codon:yes stop_codon:yes gene_type:complete
MEIRYGAGGKPMVVQPVQEIAETKNEKQEVLQEILTENPNEEDIADEEDTVGDVGDYDGFDEDVVGDDGC